MKIPFHRPAFNKSTIAEIKDVIDSGWVTTGKKTLLFEEKLCDYLDSKHVIAVNSCTAALHLGAVISGLTKNDFFIVPSYTFVSSIEIGEYIKALPLIVDIDKKTMNLDLNQVEHLLKKYGKKIKTIIPVHLAGNPVEMKKLIEIKEKYGCFILEDSAHALEAVDNNKKIGNTNDAAAFSFYANKNITTGGEGGAISTNDRSKAEKIRKLSLHGMNKDGWSRYSNKGRWSYDIGSLGYKYNLTDIASSIGLIQLSHVNEWHLKRESIFKKYNKSFKKIEGIAVPPESSKRSRHARHLYIIRIVKDLWSISRDEIIIMLNKLGVGTSVHYKPIHMHSYYQKKYDFEPNNFPNSKETYENAISLPLYPDLKDNEILFVINTIKELWDEFSISK